VSSTRLIVRHAVVSLAFLAAYLCCSIVPKSFFVSRMGFVAWYPAVGLVMALLLGVSAWYALLACVADVFAARLIYSQPVISFSATLGAMGGVFCYGLAAHVLRGPLKIDLCLRRRQDVVRFIFVTATASAGATVFGVMSLVGDRNITWEDYNSSAIGWFLGDAVAIVGVAPFLLVHVFPYVRRWLSPTSSETSGSGEHSDEVRFSLGALAEACGQVLAIVAVCWAMFGIQDKRYGSLYMCFVPVIWIAMRQGIRRVVTGLLALNFGIVLAMQVFPPSAVTLTRAGGVDGGTNGGIRGERAAAPGT
jgi:two-component system sensor kinase FixL